MIHSAVKKAYCVLEGLPLSQEDALDLSRIEREALLDLVSLANKVKGRFVTGDHVCTITNAQSGACVENCRYCAQSSFHQSDIEVYPLRSKDSLVADAEKAYQSGVRHFGIVTSGTGYVEVSPDFQVILDTMDEIRRRMPDMELGASLGILGEETAQALSDHGLWDYNHNLQVNPDRYAELVATTHTVAERIATLKLLKKKGVRICSGLIIGLGESLEDRVKLAYTLKELDVDIVPVNVLIPISGTPLEQAKPVSAAEIVKTFCLYRLILPQKTIKFAAGRETRMKDFQALVMLSGVNGFLTGGYLTTRGRDVSEDQLLREELQGFNG